MAVAATAFALHAQPVLNQASTAPVAGEMRIDKFWDSVSVVPRNTGANQTWNFSSFTLSAQSADTTWYLSPSAAPGNSLFAGSNLVSLSGSSYEFYKSGATNYEDMGYYDVGAIANYTNSGISYVWPVSFGTSSNDSYDGPLTGTAVGERWGTISVNASGSGTLIMPGGQQYTNVLQVITKIVDTQTTAASPSLTIKATGYEYYVAGAKAPILTMTDLTLISANGSFFLSGPKTSTMVNSAPTGIREQSNDLSWAVFPNPANEQISIKLADAGNEACTIRLYNTLGALVKQATAKNSADTNLQINVSDLSPGIYFVNATQGNKTALKKIVIE